VKRGPWRWVLFGWCWSPLLSVEQALLVLLQRASPGLGARLLVDY